MVGLDKEGTTIRGYLDYSKDITDCGIPGMLRKARRAQ